jgi:hypothetical protein
VKAALTQVLHASRLGRSLDDLDRIAGKFLDLAGPLQFQRGRANNQDALDAIMPMSQ